MPKHRDNAAATLEITASQPDGPYATSKKCPKSLSFPAIERVGRKILTSRCFSANCRGSNWFWAFQADRSGVVFADSEAEHVENGFVASPARPDSGWDAEAEDFGPFRARVSGPHRECRFGTRSETG